MIAQELKNLRSSLNLNQEEFGKIESGLTGNSKI